MMDMPKSGLWDNYYAGEARWESLFVWRFY